MQWNGEEHRIIRNVPSRYYAELQAIKTLLQTQPPDKIYSLTAEECGKYGLVGGDNQ